MVRTCGSCKTAFIIEPDDFSFYEKIQVPSPTLCPLCRSRRRMAWRNDYQFYSRICNLCQQSTLSIYSPRHPAPIYCPKCWWGDGWDAKEHGRNFDFQEPFFPQFRSLLDQVPTLSILNDDDIASSNCQYTNYFALGKDCYLVINSWKVESCMYSSCLVGAKDVLDSTILLANCENIYSSVYVDNSSRCRNIYNSSGLVDCAYCFDCRNCTDCFMSIGLRNKQYCFKNRQYSKEEYEKIVAGYKLETWSGSQQAEKEFDEFTLKYPHRFANLRNCVDSSGEYLTNSKNAKHCFIAVKVENSKYFESGDTIKDSYDCLSGGEQELCYESINPDNSNRTAFTAYCHKDTDTFYSDSCQGCENVFGCVGLKKAQYCIFNKQYSKEEYFALREKIIEHMKKNQEWGEFFPIELSPFGYNETVAQDVYPLTRDQALSQGFKWQDDLPLTSGKETIQELPDSIDDAPETLAREILSCTNCQRNYRILDQEIQFYRKNRIPLPRFCFLCRFGNLYKRRGVVRLWKRNCDCAGSQSQNKAYENSGDHFHQTGSCPNDFETAYAPDRPETVYCEQCYQAEVS